MRRQIIPNFTFDSLKTGKKITVSSFRKSAFSSTNPAHICTSDRQLLLPSNAVPQKMYQKLATEFTSPALACSAPRFSYEYAAFQAFPPLNLSTSTAPTCKAHPPPSSRIPHTRISLTPNMRPTRHSAVYRTDQPVSACYCTKLTTMDTPCKWYYCQHI